MSFIEKALLNAKNSAKRGANAKGGLPRTRPHSKSRAHESLYLDEETIREREELARPRIAVVPCRNSMERAGVVGACEDADSERAYRFLRTRVQGRLGRNGWQTIGVTSAMPGDGKTTTAINLAISLSRSVGTYVFLVDLDIQRPMVASCLGLNNLRGLNDLLSGEAALDDVLYSIGVPRLSILPNGRDGSTSSEIIGSPAIGTLVGSLRAEAPQHIIIFDLPPVLASDDVLRLAPHLDSVLFVVSQAVTHKSAVLRAKSSLENQNLLGIVLNRSNEDSQEYYY